ncbi:hypothetical protein Bca101_094386 [Brassica carinata]
MQIIQIKTSKMISFYSTSTTPESHSLLCDFEFGVVYMIGEIKITRDVERF